MSRKPVIWSLVMASLFWVRGWGQENASAACTFADGKQMSVRYEAAPATEKLHEGRVWSPGKSPIFLFTSAPLKMGDAAIPIGAYSMYVIPGKKNWTMVVNKNVAQNGKYDERQDVARAPMQSGSLSQPSKQVEIYLGHVAPKQCSLRLYYGTTGTWIEFMEQ